MRICKFQWYQRYSMCNFQELIKKEVGLLRVAKKNNVEFPGGLDFWSRNFQEIWHNFVGFPGGSFVLSGISRGKVKKWKIMSLMLIQKSMSPSSHSLDPCLIRNCFQSQWKHELLISNWRSLNFNQRRLKFPFQDSHSFKFGYEGVRNKRRFKYK